jgi:hypothetical protein
MSTVHALSGLSWPTSACDPVSFSVPVPVSIPGAVQAAASVHDSEVSVLIQFLGI